MKRTFILREDKNAQALWAFLKSNWKAMAASGTPLRIDIAPERTKRSIQQNARYWAILKEISEQAWVNGRQYSPEIFHEYLKSELLGVDELPNGKTVGKSTQKLSVEEFGEYMTAVEAFAATELGVQFMEYVA